VAVLAAGHPPLRVRWHASPHWRLHMMLAGIAFKSFARTFTSNHLACLPLAGRASCSSAPSGGQRTHGMDVLSRLPTFSCSDEGISSQCRPYHRAGPRW
jgi:hypothetical protein